MIFLQQLTLLCITAFLCQMEVTFQNNLSTERSEFLGYESYSAEKSNCSEKCKEEMECIDSKCQCITGYLLNEEYDICLDCRDCKVNERCVITQASGSFSSKCICEDGYVSVRESCKNCSEACAEKNMQCINSSCQCSKGYLLYEELGLSICLGCPKCKENEKCTVVKDKGKFSTACICKDGYIPVSALCKNNESLSFNTSSPEFSTESLSSTTSVNVIKDCDIQCDNKTEECLSYENGTDYCRCKTGFVLKDNKCQVCDKSCEDFEECFFSNVGVSCKCIDSSSRYNGDGPCIPCVLKCGENEICSFSGLSSGILEPQCSCIAGYVKNNQICQKHDQNTTTPETNTQYETKTSMSSLSTENFVTTTLSTRNSVTSKVTSKSDTTNSSSTYHADSSTSTELSQITSTSSATKDATISNNSTSVVITETNASSLKSTDVLTTADATSLAKSTTASSKIANQTNSTEEISPEFYSQSLNSTSVPKLTSPVVTLFSSQPTKENDTTIISGTTVSSSQATESSRITSSATSSSLSKSSETTVSSGINSPQTSTTKVTKTLTSGKSQSTETPQNLPETTAEKQNTTIIFVSVTSKVTKIIQSSTNQKEATSESSQHFHDADDIVLHHNQMAAIYGVGGSLICAIFLAFIVFGVFRYNRRRKGSTSNSTANFFKSYEPANSEASSQSNISIEEHVEGNALV